ncbi:MAG TPA: hypothetical protein VK008_00525, partial [Sphingobacteriaceae bacterium]|nr:hypothetical protein [Sphingobacteriaceae bacterium]
DGLGSDSLWVKKWASAKWMYIIPEPIGLDFAFSDRRGSNFEGEISPAGTRSAQFTPSSPAVRQILTYSLGAPPIPKCQKLK